MIREEGNGMPSVKEFESWLTTPEAAEELGITRQGMRKRLENRKYTAANTKLGWLVDPKDERFKRDRAIAQAKKAREDQGEKE